MNRSAKLYVNGIGVEDFDSVFPDPRITDFLKEPQDFFKVPPQLTFIGIVNGVCREPLSVCWFDEDSPYFVKLVFRKCGHVIKRHPGNRFKPQSLPEMLHTDQEIVYLRISSVETVFQAGQSHFIYSQFLQQGKIRMVGVAVIVCFIVDLQGAFPFAMLKQIIVPSVILRMDEVKRMGLQFSGQIPRLFRTAFGCVFRCNRKPLAIGRKQSGMNVQLAERAACFRFVRFPDQNRKREFTQWVFLLWFRDRAMRGGSPFSTFSPVPHEIGERPCQTGCDGSTITRRGNQISCRSTRARMSGISYRFLA
ncbi:hypothetical protein FOI68_06965 [Brevibacillus sp. LEMMJ03]|uniref:hypothetical protein n=1 Tax=Brevibacillus sp. LEMMJ03 TaxID=2595056 RepID=UPI00117F59EE|nr:hypothetical protein [Brevibacillus sp. LEMMJ03]TRY26601.1 hypothetical protein FOI68_06965 [Brevibacillus sp. LEMMJ03]